MRVTSKSQLKKNTKFKLSLFKYPFCFKENKKYKIYEMPKFKSKFFLSKSKKFSNLGKILFVSGPARNGNHVLLSLLDGHSQIAPEVGEDDTLRTIFSHVNQSEKKTEKNLKKIDYFLKLSSQPRFGKGLGKDKWFEIYRLRNKNIKSKVWSGNQPEGVGHITDFQNFIPNLNYNLYRDTLNKKISSTNNKVFLDFFSDYLVSKRELTNKLNKTKQKYKYRYSGSGLRRELFYLLPRNKNIICLTPIRRFETFYFSYAKTRHFTNKIQQNALNNLWEHWRHKVVDYLLLKKKYPNNIFFIKFEDIISTPEKISKKICKILGIPFEKKMLQATIMNKKVLGNSSFKKSGQDKGKFYKSSLQKKLPEGILPNEYKEILHLINRYSI